MNLNRTNFTRLAALALATGLTVGCASTSDLESLRAQIQQAQSDADMAKQDAAQARATAEQALRMSQDTDERVNRMFRRSMFK